MQIGKIYRKRQLIKLIIVMSLAVVTVGLTPSAITSQSNMFIQVSDALSAPTSIPDAIFADGFESGNLSAWTSSVTGSGDLSVTGPAALVGSRGLQSLINNKTSMYATDDTPNAEPRYRARFYFTPNSITMATNDAHFVFCGYTGESTLVLRTEFRYSGSAYQIRAALVNDGSNWTTSNWHTVSNAPHFIELDWKASSMPGANDGYLTLWIDGAQRQDLTGVDNDTRRIDRVRLGSVSDVDNSTRGTYYFDAFESRRQTYIGPAGDPPTPTPTLTPMPTPTNTTVPPTSTPTPAATPTPSATSTEVINPANIATLANRTNVLINFDNFSSPQDGLSILTGYAGCTWNSLVEGSPWAGITTWNFYVANGGLQGTIIFPQPVIVKSLRISSGVSNITTLSSTGNPTVALNTSGSNPQTLMTNWTSPVSSLTLRSSTSDQVFDDLRLVISSGGASPTSTPTSATTSTPDQTTTPTSAPTSTPTAPAATSTPTPTPTGTPTSISTSTPAAPTATPTPTPIPTSISTSLPTATPTPPTSNGIVADHMVIEQFSQIPQTAIDAAAAKLTLFMHQSTGGLIDDSGLGCLAGLHDDPQHYPQECATYAANRLANLWPWYDKSNWSWDFWPDPQADAIAKTDQFVNVVHARAASYQIIGMKYCYVDGWNQSDNVERNYYINAMLQLEAQYPGKTFIWATSALWQEPGSACGGLFDSCQQIAQFNQQVRAYALAHNKPLFDIADIESHDQNGSPCVVGGYEGLCAQWYDSGGGHPNTDGAIRIAKGFWWLMARISGWN